MLPNLWCIVYLIRIHILLCIIKYKLKLVQNKINGLNNYSYSQISSLTGYTKIQLIRLSKELNKKDINVDMLYNK